VSLVVCADLSPASWIVTSNGPWQRLVTFGPAGFAAYARVRFIPDPIHDGQQEHKADLDASPGETDQWRALLQLLAGSTSSPSRRESTRRRRRPHRNQRSMIETARAPAPDGLADRPEPSDGSR
jgi:hypothetical protein